MREICTAMFEQIQSDIYTQNSCAHDEIVSPSSDHDVKIEQPLEKPTFIRLLPSLFTILGVIWKTQGQLRWLKVELSEDQNLENCQQCITLLIFLEKQLNIVFEQNLGTRVNAVRNQSVGNLMIYNLKEEDVGIDPDLKKIFWRWRKTWNRDIYKTLEFSRELFHSLRWRKWKISTTENLPNFWRSFRYGKRPWKTRLRCSPHHVLRDVDSGDEHLHSLTISVKDQNGDLFYSNGFPLQMELEINW